MFKLASKKLNRWAQIFVVRRNRNNSVISKLMTFVENAETDQF
jgi:hypothetical protein